MNSNPEQPAALAGRIAAADAALKPFAAKFTAAGLLVLRDLWLTDPKLAIGIAVGTKAPATATALHREAEVLADLLADRFVPIGRESFIEMYLRDPQGARKLASTMSKASTKPADAPTPAPPAQHSSASADAEMPVEERIKAGVALIAEIRAAGRHMSYEAARNEARSQRPGLFT